MFFNANGLAGKADGVLRFVKEQAVDCCFIVETWLKETDSTGRLKPFVNLTRNSEEILERGGRRGRGGILGFCSPEWDNDIRVISSAPEKHYTFVVISDIIVGICYLPPTLRNSVIDEFIDEAAELSNDFGIETVLVGDFNARCGQESGDTALNTRGIGLLKKLRDLPCQLVQPVSGKWTTFATSGRGAGITDHVIASESIDIVELTVHENENLGGSDHRPLTFSFGPEIPKIEKDFNRWNIRKLAKEEARLEYLQTLEATEAQTLSGLTRLRSNMNGNDKETANRSWKLVKEWIENAARMSCGLFSFKTGINKDFWTEELEQLKEEIEQLESARQRAIINDDVLQAQHLAKEITDFNFVYREKMSEQKYKLFIDLVNDLGNPQNDGSFMRMAKCIKGRKENSGCKLDPVKVNEYAEYFTSTFGSEPLGNILLYNNTIGTKVEVENNQVPLFEPQDIRKAIASIKHGKAAGVDGIPGEFYKYGGESMIRVFTFLCNILLDSDIPDEWTEALIVPIYKKKGSDSEIANYRPIALTCVGRRVFEKAFVKHLDIVASKLNDYQGGFRSQRSTLDSAFCLHEVIIEHPDMINVFLDLKAAYDMVDRRILFKQLEQMNLPKEVITILKRLFDFNKSYLIVKGRKSDPIPNLRGLLQGSSLSPLLFNLFINELVNILRQRDSPKVTTAGMKTNCLFFADDGNLHAENVGDMKKLLLICENWSYRVGMQFAPTKCFVLARTGTRLLLYGNELPQPDQTAYLGIIYTWRGILWSQHLEKRKANALKFYGFLKDAGMNLTGWPQRSSALVYKSFIRSTLEYGIGLTVLEKEHLNKLQLVQNTCLRSIMSCHRTVSIKALHRCLNIETMEHRNHQLNISFAARLHNSKDSRMPAVNMWWNKVTDRDSKSLAVICKNKNPLWPRSYKLNHVLERRQRGEYIPQKAFTKQEKKRLVKESIVRNLDNQTSVAAAVMVDMDDPIRHCMMPNAFKDKKTRSTVLRWIIGGVANHQTCNQCGDEELSREHALECSGAHELLRSYYLEHQEQDNNELFINQLLNKFRNGPPDDDFYERIAEAVGLIYTKCLGFRQKRSAFWVPDEVDVDQNAEQNHHQRVRPLAQPASITDRRRRIALERNRPIGRPRSGIG